MVLNYIHWYINADIRGVDAKNLIAENSFLEKSQFFGPGICRQAVGRALPQGGHASLQCPHATDCFV